MMEVSYLQGFIEDAIAFAPQIALAILTLIIGFWIWLP